MRKLFAILVETVFWLQFFLAPVGLGGLIAVAIYISNQDLLWLSMVIMIISVIVGVLYAERIRKKRGTSRYAAKILATPDIWPDEYPEENKAVKKGGQ